MLGHYYRIVENDIEKAKRCYQKAFALGKVPFKHFQLILDF